VQDIIVKTSQFKTVCKNDDCCITRLKQQKTKNVIRYYLSAHWICGDVLLS